MSLIEDRIKESIDTKTSILQSPELIATIEKAADQVKGTLSGGGKVLLCGNGGSASDSLHL